MDYGDMGLRGHDTNYTIFRPLLLRRRAQLVSCPRNLHNGIATLKYRFQMQYVVINYMAEDEL